MILDGRVSPSPKTGNSDTNRKETESFPNRLPRSFHCWAFEKEESDLRGSHEESQYGTAGSYRKGPPCPAPWRPAQNAQWLEVRLRLVVGSLLSCCPSTQPRRESHCGSPTLRTRGGSASYFTANHHASPYSLYKRVPTHPPLLPRWGFRPL